MALLILISFLAFFPQQEEFYQQLQEQHYQQYVNEVYSSQLVSQREQFKQLRAILDQNNGQYGGFTMENLEGSLSLYVCFTYTYTHALAFFPL